MPSPRQLVAINELNAHTAIPVAQPLRGEWRAWNTPAEAVPSHGTDRLAQRYAIDFTRFDWQRRSFNRGGWSRFLLGVVPVDDFPAWSQPVFAPIAGRIVDADDKMQDHRLINLLTSVGRSILAQHFQRSNWKSLTGNFCVIAGQDGIHAMLAHLQENSLRIKIGDIVSASDEIGRVGNSGNSSFPHLHFQLMSGPDPSCAEGILASIERYECFVDGVWIQVRNGIPSRSDRIRF